MVTDTAFIASVDAVLEVIGAAIDAAMEERDVDADWSLNEGILEIDCGAGGKLIVNRHLINREIWVAARTGGFHFRGDREAWRDTRSGETLADTLARLLREQAGIDVDLSRLPLPL